MQQTMLSLVEKYITLGGEAPIMGHPVYLIRFSGCNLNCTFCDTPYKDEENIRLSAADLIADIQTHARKNPQLLILFTGGEPLLSERRESLVHIIRTLPQLHFYIETNGTLLIPKIDFPHCHYVVDWKAPSAGAALPFAETNLTSLKSDKDCIKMVITAEDFEWAKAAIEQIKHSSPRLPIYLSAVWRQLKLSRLAEFIITQKLPVSLSVQLHKLIWGEKARGV
jgi:7-carboxy-7-deazaguanine synthase